MPALSPQQLRHRLALDYRVMMALTSPVLSGVRPFVSQEDFATTGRNATAEEGEAGRVVLYAASLAFPVLTGPGELFPGPTQVRFDLRAARNYPFDAPVVTVVSRPLPWSPHVQPVTGLVCQGEIWGLGHGRMLLGQLLIHVMRVLNCDEPDRGHLYAGWNGDAASYWRTTMGCRPLTPDLSYPALPTGITHGRETPSVFRAVAPVSNGGASLFRALGPVAPGLFRPVEGS